MATPGVGWSRGRFEPPTFGLLPDRAATHGCNVLLERAESAKRVHCDQRPGPTGWLLRRRTPMITWSDRLGLGHPEQVANGQRPLRRISRQPGRKPNRRPPETTGRCRGSMHRSHPSKFVHFALPWRFDASTAPAHTYCANRRENFRPSKATTRNAKAHAPSHHLTGEFLEGTALPFTFMPSKLRK
jgi:hypothetical protein